MRKFLKMLLFLCLALLPIIPLGACSKSKEDFSDTYNAETDFPLDGLRFMGSPVTGMNGGCYIVQGHFLLFLPDGSDEAVCVCGKPNCEHYKSADMDKYLQCDAYIPGLAMVRSVNNTLYALAYAQLPNKDGSYDAAVYKISADGSQREELFTIPLNGKMDIGAFAIHRGYAYYIGDWFGKDGKLTSALYRHSLSNTKAEVEELYVANGQYSQNLQCYGKYIYFDTYTDGIFTDTHTMQYNLQTKKTVPFFTDQEGICVSKPFRIGDKFLITKGKFKSETELITEFYWTDLNGKKAEQFTAIDNNIGALACDGKYLYGSTFYQQDDSLGDLITAYSSDGTVVATLDSSFEEIIVSSDGVAAVTTDFWANGRIFIVNGYDGYTLYAANSADFAVTGKIEPKLVFTSVINHTEQEVTYIDMCNGEVVGAYHLED